MRARTPSWRQRTDSSSSSGASSSSVRDYAIFMLDPAGHVLSWNAGRAAHQGVRGGRDHRPALLASSTPPRTSARRHPEHELEVAAREGRYEEEGWRVRKDGTRFWASVAITALRDEDGGLTGFAKVTRDLTIASGRPTWRSATRSTSCGPPTRSSTASPPSRRTTSRTPCGRSPGFAELLERSGLAAGRARVRAAHRRQQQPPHADAPGAARVRPRRSARRRSEEPVDLARAVDARARRPRGPDRRARRCGDRRAAGRGDGARRHRRRPRRAAEPALQRAEVLGRRDRPRCASRPRAATTAGTSPSRTTGRASRRTSGSGSSGRSSAATRQRGVTATASGLAICERLIERHGGEIGVDAAPEGGSRFWFSLRAGSRPPASSPPSRPPR